MESELKVSDCSGRIRTIKPFFFKDESLGCCSPKSIILLTGLFVFSSKYGLMFNDELRIKSQIFPFEKNLNINPLLSELEKLRIISRYKCNGVSYLKINNIKKWCEIPSSPQDFASSAKRRALKRNALPLWADLNEIKRIYAKAKQMCLSGESVHVDHEIPLSGKNVCGLHIHTNLKIISATENMKKSNKFEVN